MDGSNRMEKTWRAFSGGDHVYFALRRPGQEHREFRQGQRGPLRSHRSKVAGGGEPETGRDHVTS